MTSLSVFWIAAGVMSLFALAFLLPPLLRRHSQQENDETAAEIAIYRQRLQELKAELHHGILTEEQFSHAQHELEEAMAADLAIGSSTDLKIKRHWLTALILTILVPSLAFLTYWQVGASGKVGEQLASKETSQQEIDRIGHAIKSLQAHLVEDPEDAQGWQLLGKTYLATNQVSEAAEALGHAYALDDQNPDIILDYAKALATSQERRLQGAPLKLIQRVLKIAPQHPEALWLAAVNALQSNQNEKAKTYLEQLALQLPPGSDEERMVRAHLAQLSSSSEAIANTNTGGGGEASDKKVSTEGNKQSPRIEVQVVLDPTLKDKAADTSTVFIFARAAKGPPMPLAAVRKQVKDLPLTVVLDDSKAMAPSFRMSNFNEFQVGARISLSGNPIPQSGDLQGFVDGNLSGNPTSPVSVTINQIVP
ncbi:cytochrome C biogenesis protein CcmI [Candidatus Nitrosoglobus terrae]|uniref:Cytochrome C biogenesis protein CcmI n=1 Tax=Candidatus Nitrosoglobus terrae TaxID=1630141 RepID=A0A1Q2SNV9_9GAMM|nr:c-type cytochrome biogenesis protein CcmI [Candidatus Nitrosoglobus terrae]BAW80828.1 cytochrome C biogenesis protein CcmI [Candidatus Nitrosoglobus terrae]